MADFLDEYVVRMGNPNSKEYKRALGRIEADKLRESEKQTEILKEAEEERTRILERQIRMQEEQNKLKKIEEETKKIQQQIQEEQQYNFRRNQQIFDNIGVNYNNIEDFFELLESINNKIDDGCKVSTFEIEYEKKQKKNTVENIENNIEFMKNNIKRS